MISQAPLQLSALFLQKLSGNLLDIHPSQIWYHVLESRPVSTFVDSFPSKQIWTWFRHNKRNFTTFKRLSNKMIP